MQRTFALLIPCLVAAACGDWARSAAAGDALRALNANLVLPEGSYQVEDPGVDASVEVARGGDQILRVVGGTTLDRRLSFSAGGAEIVAAGIRFGATGPIRILPASCADSTLDFSLVLPESLCALSAAGHPVECHEFAVTDRGQVSRPRISRVAFSCGYSCDQPDCGASGRSDHRGTMSWQGPDGTRRSTSAMAVENPPIHGGSSRVLWIGGSVSSAEDVLIQVPIDVPVGIHGITSDRRFHVQFTSQKAVAALWQDHPRGGRGTITVTRHTDTSIAGSFSFRAHNVKGLVEVKVSGTFDLPVHRAALDPSAADAPLLRP
jgi:hypothetical protein